MQLDRHRVNAPGRRPRDKFGAMVSIGNGTNGRRAPEGDGCRRHERICRWLAPVAALVALCGAVPASATSPRGDLQVHGATRVGEELRADASGITDADGGVAAVTYHWRHAVARRVRGRLFLRMCEGADCANLATGDTYLLTSSDRGKYMGVQATVIDGEGNQHYVGRALWPMVREGGVSASESVLQVSEGESGTYEVALRSRPDDTVTVNITGHEGTDVSVNPASLAFTVDDWSTARTVTVGVAADEDTVSDAAVTLVHQPSGGGFDDMGGDLVTVLPGEEQGTLTANFSNTPAWHASEGFTFRVSFSQEVTVTAAAMRDEVFTVTGGSVSSANRTAPPSNAAWAVAVLPASSADVSVLLPATSDCAATGAVCTSGGLKLTAGASLTVPHEWKVGGVSAFAGNGDVQVSWSMLEGSASYKVQWKSGNRTFSEAAADGRELTTPGTSTQATVAGLTSGTTYTFRVMGVAADGTQSMPSDTDWTSPWPTEPLTGTLELPATHDGSTRFGGRVVFSESVLVSNGTARDSFEIGNGRLVTVDSSDASAWDFEIEPSGTGTVSIVVPANRSCAQTGAICTADWRRLSADLAASVTGPPQGQQAPAPLVASFVSVPAEHDGVTEFWLELSFDAAVVQGSKPHIRALLGVSGGSVTRLRRKDGRLDHWRVRVEPSSHEAVTVALSPSPACGATGAVCTQDGRTFTAAIATRIEGPPGLAVADAQVQEAANATLAFVVTLDRAAASTVTVGYATSDGTATAGSDYTAASGMLTFAAGETEKTVSVAVLDDAHDEGSETLGLTLSNASGAHIADGSATGTINNTDHMPQAWLARFGRTVADQVVDAVGERLRGPGGAGAEVRVAGQDLSGATPDGEATREAEAQARIESLAKWLRGESEEDRQPLQSRTLTSRDFLTGTSFALTGGTAQTGFGSLWGRGALSRFDGREDELTLDGEVASAMLGADWTLGRGMAGLAVARSRGEGGYRAPAGSGEVETTLTGLYPYGRYAVDERLTVWGVLGYGTGTLTLTPEGQPPMEADTDLAMAAAGVRGELLRAPESGGMALAVRSDALAVRTTSETVPGPGGMKASEADVTRLRLGLEGSRAFRSGAGAALTPSLDIGVRHDGGDAETGFGVDIGAGLAWTDPASGMKAKVDARGLLTHEDGGFRERGIAGSFAWDPSPSSGLGPSLTLRHSVGVSATGGVSALLNPDTARRLAANDDGDEFDRRRFEAVLGYGHPVLGHRFIGTPELGMGVSDTGREVRLGWRLGLARGNERVSFTLGLEAAHRESTNDEREPEDRIGLRLSLRW